MTPYKNRSLRAPLRIVLSRYRRFELPVGLASIQMWPVGPKSWVVSIKNSQYKKGTHTVVKMRFRSEQDGDQAIAEILKQIDVTYVDARETLERNAQPILEFLATNPTSPEGLVALMNTPEALDAGAYLLARSLGHIVGPLSCVCWHYFGDRRPDCWEVRTISIAAEVSPNVGTPMHRFGGNPSCSESIISPWLPVAPADPARALAEAMLYDAGPDGIINGYDYYTLNTKRRAELRQAS